MTFPLATSSVEALGLDPKPIGRLRELITAHIAEGRYPRRRSPSPARQARPLRTLRRRAPRAHARAGARRHALAALLEHEGHHRVRGVAPGRARRAALHRPGRRSRARLRGQRQGRHHDHPAPRATRAASPTPTCRRPRGRITSCCARSVCDFTLEWTPGSRVVLSPPRRALGRRGPDRGAHQDGLPRVHPREHRRAARPGRRAVRRPARSACTRARSTCTSRRTTAGGRSSAREESNPPSSGAPARRAAAATRPRARWRPSTRCWLAGGHAQRRAAPLAADGRSTSRATYTGDRVDGYMGMPMHRGLGPHVRGTTETIRGLGSLASPRTFGHGGVGSSYCWADPGLRACRSRT